MKKIDAVVLSLFALTVFFLGPTPELGAQAEQFYKGKTIWLVIGNTTGGFYDRWGRLLARFMGKNIPGQPEIVPQNMPGAGSLIATNNVYRVAKPDGLTMVMPLNGIYIDQLVGRAEAQFDLRKFHFVGSPAVESLIFYMRADAPHKTIAEVIKAKEPPKCGSTGTASSDYILSKILEEAVGAKFNTVMGYAGGSEIDIAVEKGEVVCRAHSLSAHFGREPFDSWHKKNFDRHILQTARKRDANLMDTPTLNEVFDQYKASANIRRLSQILLAAGEFGRPIMVTPGTPAERVKMLRDAFIKTMNDPEVIAEARKGRMDIDTTTGEELETLVKDIFDAPADVIERAKKLLAQ